MKIFDFTLEHPSETDLPFLDTNIQFSNNIFSITSDAKPTNTGSSHSILFLLSLQV